MVWSGSEPESTPSASDVELSDVDISDIFPPMRSYNASSPVGWRGGDVVRHLYDYPGRICATGLIVRGLPELPMVLTTLCKPGGL